MDASITPVALRRSLESDRPPLLIDVRRGETFLAARDIIPGALRRDPAQVEAWKGALPAGRDIVVYCVHGHEVSQNAAKALGGRYLVGGIDAWAQGGGAIGAKPAGASTRWVTRERPKIDRIACPWLVRRFVDPLAEFLYVPDGEVKAMAAAQGAEPYDIPGVRFSHDGDRCSFDAFLRHYRLRDPALDALAAIVRGADTGRLDLAPQAPGLLAISLGLSRLYPDDHEMLAHGMTVYDALYAWCREGTKETHNWNPAAYK